MSKEWITPERRRAIATYAALHGTRAAASVHGVAERTVRLYIQRFQFPKHKKLRCVECGEYRRVHRNGSHPFISPESRGNGNKIVLRWAQRTMPNWLHQEFVDAVRHMLGLDPLYGNW